MRSAYLISFLLPAALADYYGGGDSASTTSSAAASSPSGTHDVQVGPGSRFVFDPDTVTATSECQYDGGRTATARASSRAVISDTTITPLENKEEMIPFSTQRPSGETE